MPTRENLTIYQGASFEIEITHLESDGSTSVPAASVSAVRMQARETYDSDTAALDLDNSGKGGIAVTDGLITVTVSAANSAAIGFEVGVYDIEVDYTDGTTERLMMGRLIVSREVTR